MARGRASRAKRASAGALTPGQQQWLRHLQACARSGETIRAYARRHELSEPGMYQAVKVLRRRGVWPARQQAKPAPFVRVEREAVRSPAPEGVWRVRSPRGVVFETTTPVHREALALVLDALGCPR